MNCKPSAASAFYVVVSLVACAVGQDPQQQRPGDQDPQAPKLVATFRSHATGVTALAFSPDGRQLVSASRQDVRTWDPATGRQMASWNTLGGRVVALSPGGQRIAVADRQNVTVHETSGGKELLGIDPHGDWDRTFPFRPAVVAIAFSLDGSRFATAGSVAKVGGRHGLPGGIVAIWDTKTGQALRRFDTLSTSASSVAFSADGKLVAGGTNGAGGELPEPGEVWVWDLETGQELRRIKAAAESQPGEFISIADVAFSPNGNHLAAAVGSGSRGRPAGLLINEAASQIRVWELATGKETLNLRGHASSVERLVFSPDGKQLASAGRDRVVRVWSTLTGKQMKAFPFDAASIGALAYNPDGQSLVAGGGSDEQPGEISVWANMTLLTSVGDAATSIGQTVPPQPPSPETVAQLVDEDKHWQDLDAPRRGLKERIVRILAKTPALSDQQVASAVYLLTVGRSPDDQEFKQAQTAFAETSGRTLSVLQLARGLVQGDDFSTEVAAANSRLLKTQTDVASEPGTELAIGDNARRLTADAFRQLVSDCAEAVDQPANADAQVVNLAYLLTLSRFPTATESRQVVAHLKKAGDRATGCRDIFVFLLNGKEFLTSR